MKYYTREHEWFELTDQADTYRMGITNFAQDQLGDVVNVELPEVGAEIHADDACGVVESVKSASDINSPLTGVVTKVNEELRNKPELINASAESDAWMIEVKVTQEPDLAASMSEQEYAAAFPMGAND